MSKLSVRHCKESKAPYLHKCTPKTYATLSGAKRQLIEYKEDVSNLEELAEKAKLEEGIKAALTGKRIQKNKEALSYDT